MVVNNSRNLLEIANAQIIFKNFSGREKTAIVNGRQKVVNDAGRRNFQVILDPEQSEIWWNGERVSNPDFGQELAEIGFNITAKPGREEGDPVQYRLPVAVSYDSNISPKLYLISNGNKVLIDAETIDSLDYMDIIKADIVINNGRPYENNNGRMMVKAWCNEGYFTLARSRFANVYEDTSFNDVQ